MLKRILIGLGLVVALAWFYWWASLGFPAHIDVYDEATKQQQSYNVLFGSIWKSAAALHPYEGLIAALATVVIAIFTIVLWGATDTLARAERNKRSVISGGGQKIPRFPDVFEIQAINAGQGSALVRRVRWGFGDLGALPLIPVYDGDATAREPLVPGALRAVRHVPILKRHYRTPVVFVRFDYYDVNQKRKGSIGFVMILESPDFPLLPVPTMDVPTAYMADDFPLEV